MVGRTGRPTGIGVGDCAMMPARAPALGYLGVTNMFALLRLLPRSDHDKDTESPAAAGPACSNCSSWRSCCGLSLDGGPLGPFDASAASPPATHARRHTRADLVEISSRAATSTGDMPDANSVAACRRTCSRFARPAEVTPPPSAYRTHRSCQTS